MASNTEIAKHALDLIGADTIGSLNDNTRNANLCNRLLPLMRAEMLVRHPWNFASRRASLPASDTAPAWGFAYAYEMPTDYLRILRLNLFDPNQNWKVEYGQIVTDAAAPLQILYIANVADAGRYSPLFSTTLAYRLAAELAGPITESDSKRRSLMSDVETSLRAARSADAAEGSADPILSNFFLDARL